MNGVSLPHQRRVIGNDYRYAFAVRIDESPARIGHKVLERLRQMMIHLVTFLCVDVVEAIFQSSATRLSVLLDVLYVVTAEYIDLYTTYTRIICFRVTL